MRKKCATHASVKFCACPHVDTFERQLGDMHQSGISDPLAALEIKRLELEKWSQVRKAGVSYLIEIEEAKRLQLNKRRNVLDSSI